MTDNTMRLSKFECKELIHIASLVGTDAEVPDLKLIVYVNLLLATHTDEVLDKVLSELPKEETYDGQHQGNQMERDAHNRLLNEVKQIIEKHKSKPDDGKRG